MILSEKTEGWVCLDKLMSKTSDMYNLYYKEKNIQKKKNEFYITKSKILLTTKVSNTIIKRLYHDIKKTT